MKNRTKTMYRYSDTLGVGAVYLVLDSFEVVKETACHCWVARASWVAVSCDSPEKFDRFLRSGEIKKVRKGAARSFCHVDRLAALRAYFQRKKRQACLLEQQTARNEQALAFLAKKPLEDLVLEASDGADLGRHAIHDKYEWVEC